MNNDIVNLTNQELIQVYRLLLQQKEFLENEKNKLLGEENDR